MVYVINEMHVSLLLRFVEPPLQLENIEAQQHIPAPSKRLAASMDEQYKWKKVFNNQFVGVDIRNAPLNDYFLKGETLQQVLVHHVETWEAKIKKAVGRHSKVHAYTEDDEHVYI